MAPIKAKKHGVVENNGASSSHLWVGNLPLDISELELSELFGKHGVIDGITCYPSRSYAFVYFKRVDDAIAAKDSLQGFLINSSPIKIEFAKPAKPSKHVWIGGFGSSVTREKLEEELCKYGKIEELKFFRDRNTALVDFASLEDASAAVKNMNKTQIGDDRIRVDFLRSLPPKRDQSDLHDMGNAQFRGVGAFDPSWDNPEMLMNYAEPTYLGHKRQQQSQPFGGRKGGHPSKVLWVGYPPSVVIDEEMLHNAMILHGEIERIKCFPARHYSFVEFRSVEEARQAKDALQGRLFNDPRISIMFSNSDLAPGKELGPPYSAFRGQIPDMFATELPFRPPVLAMLPNNFHGPPVMNGVLGPGLARQFGPRGKLDPLLPTPDFTMSELTANASINQRKMPSSGAGLLPSPALPGRAAYKTSGWDVLDPNQLSRESKRSRIDGPTSFHDRLKRGDDYIGGGNQPYNAGPQFVGGPLTRGHVGSDLNSSDFGVGKGNVMGRANEDYIWRGVIAKGGNPVCNARCIPMGGLDCELPEVINCSARTGLDMLTKHHATAIGFDIVFFLPDSEDDFANYTEFLRYLGSKNRAGVAKLDDGTTLFLVPPSDFLTDVLQVAGRERLYGVVLKLPHSGGSSLPQSVHQALPPIQPPESQLGPHTHEYVASDKELAGHMDYGRALHDDTTIHSKIPFLNPSIAQVPSNEVPSAQRPAVKLTPELIATLQAIMPANSQPSVAQSSQPQLSSSTTGLTLPTLTNEKGSFSQGWTQQLQADQSGQSQLFGVQGYPNAPIAPNYQSFPSNLNVVSHPVPSHPANMQMHNPVYNLQEQDSISSRTSTVHPGTSQSQLLMPPMQNMQPYSLEATRNSQKGYGLVHGTVASSYGIAESQQHTDPSSYSNQVSGALHSHPESMLPASTGNVNLESVNAPAISQILPSGSQGRSDVDVDKNQRYQSTLEFAANLLAQIRQQEQQQKQQ